MAQLFNIQDDKVVINKLALKYMEGSVIHAGSFDIVGSANVQNTLTANAITVDTLTVKNLVTPKTENAPTDLGEWIYQTEEELVGKGLNWTWGQGALRVFYKNGGKLWISGDVDLAADKSYKINDTEVLSANSLGPQVTKSKLKEVGTLKSLSVSGDSSISEFAYFNSGLARLGLNTDQPNSTFSIVENDVEFVVGSPNYGTATLGTYTNHDLSIITDNTPRLTFKNSGEIVFGSELTKNANVVINGTLKVNSVVTDNRMDRYSPLEFKTARGQSVYGLGIVWSGADVKRLIIVDNPDRLLSSESFDLAPSKAYFINGIPVLSESKLGNHVIESSLTKLGVLDSLVVSGDTEFQGSSTFKSAKSRTLLLDNDYKKLSLSATGFNSDSEFSIKVLEDEVYFADSQEITIGNRQNNRRSVKVYGQLSVGITTPDDDVAFSVNGDVRLNDKKFITGNSIPTTGSFAKGDICWNSAPAEGNYIGWVCVDSGAPGIWVPFGTIGR